MNLALAFPPLILALAFVGFLGAGIVNASIALALTGWPVYGRLALAETRLLRQSDYIAAAEMQGIHGLRLFWGHLLPACWPAAQVRLAFDLGATILAIAALGYLGLGARPPAPEWGQLIAEGSRSGLEYWWLAVFPGAAIFLASLAFNVIADSWRDRRDTRRA
jgi:peptide/nickel transport system permease protein